MSAAAVMDDRYRRARRGARRARQRGLSAVEFAVVSAAVFILIFGVIEVARAGF